MPSSRLAISTPNAPHPAGNFSQAVRSGSTLYLSGFLGDDPTTREIVSDSIEAQTEQAIRNMQAVLEAAGCSLDCVVSRRIYVLDVKELRQVDRVWGEWFEEPHPVSTALQVVGLAKEGARVELEVVAVLPQPEK